MTYKQGHDLQSSFMDGISVKISEEYKPPPRISLPVTYSQRLSLNKKLQDNMPEYSFVLEKKVKEQLEALKAARSLLKEERQSRLERVEEERRKRQESKQKIGEIKESEEKSRAEHVYTSNAATLLPTNVQTSCSKILTPIPLNSFVNKSFSDAVDKSPLNISDFEADTSSPFDNMELKSINDMEELAQVLNSEEKAYNPTYAQNYSNYLPTPHQDTLHYNSYHIPPTTSSYTYSDPHPGPYNGLNTLSLSHSAYSTYAYPNQNCETTASSQQSLSPIVNRTEETMRVYNRIPEIMKALEAELNNYQITDDKYSNHSANCVSSGTNTVEPCEERSSAGDLENPFNTLTSELQELSKGISSMGFPLPRVARACKLFGSDNKKVIEHLLAVSELMDLGFPEKEVTNALVQCNNDRDKALDKLIVL